MQLPRSWVPHRLLVHLLLFLPFFPSLPSTSQSPVLCRFRHPNQCSSLPDTLDARGAGGGTRNAPVANISISHPTSFIRDTDQNTQCVVVCFRILLWRSTNSLTLPPPPFSVLSAAATNPLALEGPSRHFLSFPVAGGSFSDIFQKEQNVSFEFDPSCQWPATFPNHVLASFPPQQKVFQESVLTTSLEGNIEQMTRKRNIPVVTDHCSLLFLLLLLIPYGWRVKCTCVVRRKQLGTCSSIKKPSKSSTCRVESTLNRETQDTSWASSQLSPNIPGVRGSEEEKKRDKEGNGKSFEHSVLLDFCLDSLDLCRGAYQRIRHQRRCNTSSATLSFIVASSTKTPSSLTLYLPVGFSSHISTTNILSQVFLLPFSRLGLPWQTDETGSPVVFSSPLLNECFRVLSCPMFPLNFKHSPVHLPHFTGVSSIMNAEQSKSLLSSGHLSADPYINNCYSEMCMSTTQVGMYCPTSGSASDIKARKTPDTFQLHSPENIRLAGWSQRCSS